MKTKKLFQCMTLASVTLFSSISMANNNTPDEEKVIELTNQNNNGTNNETLRVPVTATVNSQVLNVQFTGTVPMATVSVNNAQTGATISRQTMTATSGTVSMIPLPELTMGTVTVTNEVSGETVSGEFEMK